jgi:hypothetical protein
MLKFLKVGILLLAAVATTGCVGTRAAYKAADGDPEKIAYVATEHYSVLLNKAANAKEAGRLTGSVLVRVQAVERKATPIFVGDKEAVPAKAGLFQLRETYIRTGEAKDRGELEKALPEAIQVLNDFINAMKGVF